MVLFCTGILRASSFIGFPGGPGEQRLREAQLLPGRKLRTQDRDHIMMTLVGWLYLTIVLTVNRRAELETT